MKDSLENQVLTPGYPPLNIEGVSSWSDTFLKLFQQSDELLVITGYVSEGALNFLIDLIEQNKISQTSNLKSFSFCLGMAYFDGLTQRQKTSLIALDEALAKSKLGRVHIPLGIKVHAKATLGSTPSGGFVLFGSTNFTAILPQRQSELDILLDLNDVKAKTVKEYVHNVFATSQTLDPAVLSAIPVNKEENNRLLQAPGVSKVNSTFFSGKKLALSFELPLKTELKSNLNKFNAAPRGKIPRSWWEIELIIPTYIQNLSEFPSKKFATDEFDVYTDDGFTFKCHVSGGNAPHFNKNFESSGELGIFGYWLKGRLVTSGVLQEGELVTGEVLAKYGRSTITMTKLEEGIGWFLDMGVKTK